MISNSRGILVITPLLVGLAGSATAAMGDTSSAGNAGNSTGTAGTVDTLLNQYAGIVPVDPEIMKPESRSVTPAQRLSTFTKSTGSMNSYYTVLGSDRPISNTGDSRNRQSLDSDAAAPAVSAITLSHYVSDSLVGAVAAGITPATSGSSYSPAATITPGGTTVPNGNNESPVSTIPTETTTADQLNFTTSIIPTNQITFTTEIIPVSTPIPPAMTLFGSGLAALAMLRRRAQAFLS